MTRIRRTLGAFPAFLVGVAGAVAFETSAGLLLYLDEGLLPALTLVLTVEVGALGLGLWSSSLSVGAGAVEQVRRRWLFSLVVFALAATLAVGLRFQGDPVSTGLGQGLGLAFLGSLPLFALGSLLGAMGRPDDLGRSSLARVGVPSVLGAGAGFLLSGAVLLPHAAPYTLYLFCLVVLSGGALLQGWSLDTRLLVKAKEVVWTGHGEIRVEERVLGKPRRELLVLTEDGRVRGAEDLNGNPARPWERAILLGLEEGEITTDALMFVGGGSGTFARLFSDAFPGAAMEIVERNRELVEMAQAHFHEWEGWEEVGIRFSAPLDALSGVVEPRPMVLVDSAALCLVGGVPALEKSHWRSLVRSVGSKGVVVLGGLRFCPGEAERPLRRLMEDGAPWFETVALFVGEPVGPGAEVLPGEEAGMPAFLLLGSAQAPTWPQVLPGFRRWVVEEA